MNNKTIAASQDAKMIGTIFDYNSNDPIVIMASLQNAPA